MIIDLAQYPGFELFSQEDRIQLRSFLNQVGFETGAYVILDQTKNHIFPPAMTIKVADCQRSIALNFCCATPEETHNSIHKLERLRLVIELATKLLQEKHVPTRRAE